MRKEKLVIPILMQFLYLDCYMAEILPTGVKLYPINQSINVFRLMYRLTSYFVEKCHFAVLLLWHHNKKNAYLTTPNKGELDTQNAAYFKIIALEWFTNLLIDWLCEDLSIIPWSCLCSGQFIQCETFE